MCLAAFAGMQLGAGMLGAYGAIKGGADEQKYYESLASSDEQQAGQVAKTAELNQSSVQDQAMRETVQAENQGKAVGASQTSAQAANGVLGNSTTAEAVARDTFDKSKLDELMIRYNADQKTQAIGMNSNFQIGQLRNRANQERTAGANAATAGWINGASTLLGSASQTGMSLYGRR